VCSSDCKYTKGWLAVTATAIPTEIPELPQQVSLAAHPRCKHGKISARLSDVVAPPFCLFTERDTVFWLHDFVEILARVGSAVREDFTSAAFPYRSWTGPGLRWGKFSPAWVFSLSSPRTPIHHQTTHHLPLDLETGKTEEHGKAVHSECYALKVRLKQAPRPPNTILGFAAPDAPGAATSSGKNFF
jgi:hypothetical protein